MGSRYPAANRLLTGCLALLSACAAPADRAAESATDSAGVALVDNVEPLWQDGQEWRLSTEPVLHIGVDMGEPAYEFAYPHSPVRLTDGRIAVADMGTTQIRFFDAAGKHLTSVGRRGEGPGEFEQLYRMRKLPGDSIMALNPINLTSIFAPDGRFVRRFDLDPVKGRGNMWWVGRLGDGRLVAMSLQREGTRDMAASEARKPGEEEGHIVVPPRPEGYRDTLMHFRYSPEGALIDSIGKLPGQWLGESRVFVPNAAYAVTDCRFYHSPGHVVEIREFDACPERVQLRRIIRRPPLRDLAVTEQMKDEYRAGERAVWAQRAAANPGSRIDMAAVERQLSTTVFPASIPAHGNRIYINATNHLWLLEYQTNPSAAAKWSVFDPDGRWLGIVETPERFTVNEIGADYVLGIWTDTMQVQHVRQYRLDKPR